jgi:hypothetical protein
MRSLNAAAMASTRPFFQAASLKAAREELSNAMSIIERAS